MQRFSNFLLIKEFSRTLKALNDWYWTVIWAVKSQKLWVDWEGIGYPWVLEAENLSRTWLLETDMETISRRTSSIIFHFLIFQFSERSKFCYVLTYLWYWNYCILPISHDFHYRRLCWLWMSSSKTLSLILNCFNNHLMRFYFFKHFFQLLVIILATMQTLKISINWIQLIIVNIWTVWLNT